MNVEYTDLVMDNGELVRIECPEKYCDDLAEALENCMKRRDWWNPGMFADCEAKYMGHRLDRVNMGRVVATL